MDLKRAAELAGVPYTTAARWARQGMVLADGGGAKGRPYEIGEKNITELANLGRLRRGMSFQALRRAAETLRRMGLNPYSSGLFGVIEGGELVHLAPTGEAVKLLQQPGQRLLIPLLAPEPEDTDDRGESPDNIEDGGASAE